MNKNIIARGNLVVFSFAGLYHTGWIIGQECDGTYAIYDTNHTIRKHVFANHNNSNFTINQKLTKKFLSKNTDIPKVNLNIPQISDILYDDAIEGWNSTITGIDNKRTYLSDNENIKDSIDNTYIDDDMHNEHNDLD